MNYKEGSRCHMKQSLPHTQLSPVLDTDSNDSLVKCVEASLNLPVTSQISMQMQKHLLSSTMQPNTRLVNPRTLTGSTSPPFPVSSSLGFSSTLSASPLHSLPDLNFAMDSGKYGLGSQTNTSFEELVIPLESKRNCQSLSLVQTEQPFSSSVPHQKGEPSSGVKLLLMESDQHMNSNTPGSLALTSMSDNRLDILNSNNGSNSVTLFNPLTSNTNNSLTLLNPLTSVSTNNMGLINPIPIVSSPNMTILNPLSSNTVTVLNPLPSVTTQNLTLLKPMPPAQNSLTLFNPLVVQPPAITTNSSFPSSSLYSSGSSSTLMHPRKKRRLLTFLSEQENNKSCEQQTILLTQNQNPAPNQFLSFTPEKKVEQQLVLPQNAIICSKPDQPVILNQQTVSSLVPINKPASTILLKPDCSSNRGTDVLVTDPSLAGISHSAPTQTVFLQPCSVDQGGKQQEQTATTLIIKSQPPLRENENNSQSTLIINSEGTGATLITPVVSSPSSSSFQSNSANFGFPFQRNPPITYSTFSLGPPQNDSLLTQDSLLDPTIKGHDPQLNRISSLWSLVNCFKCKICGHLSMHETGMKHHMLDDHEELVVNGQSGEDEDSWLPTALKAGIKLICPQCPNTFTSGRSFQVHMVEDHSLGDLEADQQLIIRNQERREKALQLIRKERQKAKAERRTNRQNCYEAYLDENNELRVRMSKSLREDTESLSSVRFNPNSDEEIDVIRDCKGIKAADYVALLSETRVGINSNRTGSNKTIGSYSKLKRKKLGRPKGSRTTGLTALKRVIPSMECSEEDMGEECGVQECAVRMKDPEKLKLHKKSHVEGDDSSFVCTDLFCSEKTSGWQAMTQHLWREHSVDMELFRCPSCTFRSPSRAKLELHQVSHSESRPWLCPNCGQAFKLARQLRVHSATHKAEGQSLKNMEVDNNISCPLCHAQFSMARHLRLHIDSVHHKMKPFLCNYCGYSASSRSGLKLHLRKHTGDKPFGCPDCEYSTADHNSLRRHRMRHTGVRPYKCPHCPYSSIQSSTYKMHLKNKHSMDDLSSLMFQCSICKFKTLKENIFLAHVSQHGVSEVSNKLPGST